MNTPCFSDPLAEAVRRLAHESPQLEDLGADQLDTLCRLVAAAQLAADLSRRAQLCRIDLGDEIAAFLSQASPSGSAATVRAYAAALDRLVPRCRKLRLDPLDLSPRQADEYLLHLRAHGRSPSAVRLDSAALSAFFRFLERRHDPITNPFRGTRALPPEQHRHPRVPRDHEVAILLGGARPVAAAVVSCLAFRGLRVGALPTLQLRGARFRGVSKGRAVSGRLPPEALEAIGRAGLPADRPFAAWTSRQLGALVFSLGRRLRGRGLLACQYSAHDLRHHFAVTEYRRVPDIYRLKGLLGHRSVASTERYLRSLDLGDEAAAGDPRAASTALAVSGGR